MNYELGYRMHTNGFHAQITGFLNHYDNILGSDNISGGGAGTGNMFNAGNALIQGVEVGGSYDVLHR
ncbi:TonB-dependent receptor domain-containing protein, partial [Salmonella enterica]|uniref:TonB-dependent receptor domain-containing protein n=1 Tax=Salmonella enterica TaxID=28901 RepID=UPI003CEACFA2